MAENTTTGGKKLVAVCIDESVHSERAVKFLLDQVYRDDMEVALVHIHVLPDLPAFGLYRNPKHEYIYSTNYFEAGASVQAEVYHESIQLSVSKSRAIVEKYVNICKEKGITPKLFVETMQESIGNTICKILSAHDCQLVVLGQRGLGAFRRTILGSVSDYIIHHLHIPAIIIPPIDEA